MNFHAALREISGDTCAYETCIRESLYQYNERVRLRLVTRLGGNNVVVNVVNSYQTYHTHACTCAFDIGIPKSTIYI